MTQRDVKLSEAKKRRMLKNERRVLRKIETHKGAMDPSVVFRLEDKGLVKMSGASDTLSIELTEAGRALLNGGKNNG